MLNKNDELQIQRCVDQELSPAETRSLLHRLDSLNNGWKHLACGLLEDRNFRTAMNAAADFRKFGVQGGSIADVDSSSANATIDGTAFDGTTFGGQATTTKSTAVTPSPGGSDERPTLSRGRSVNDVARRWWSHPVTSLTLCTAIAFVSGLLIPDVHLGELNNLTSAGRQTNSAPSAPIRGQGNSYFVEMQPGRGRVEVPVVSEPNELSQLDRNHPLFSEPTTAKQKLSWRLIPIEGNRLMLLPVQEDPGLDIQ